MPSAGNELGKARRLIAISVAALVFAAGGLLATVADVTNSIDETFGAFQMRAVAEALDPQGGSGPTGPEALDLASRLDLPDARTSFSGPTPGRELAVRIPDSEASLVWRVPGVGSDIRSKYAPTRLPFILGLVAVVALLLVKLSSLARIIDAERLDARRTARQDMLTSLGNRLAFDEWLAERLERGERFALACIDLDGFKTVNDRHGHAAGDAVLRGVAARLRILCGQADAAFRLGGDEFALVLPDDGRDFARYARRIVTTLDDQYDIGAGKRAEVGASAGIAFAETGAINARVLQLGADTALYRAKSAGRGNWRFADEPSQSSWFETAA